MRLAEGPGVACGQFFLKKHEKKYFRSFLALNTPEATHECPQTISTKSIKLFGRLYATYIYIYECQLFYYIDILLLSHSINENMRYIAYLKGVLSCKQDRCSFRIYMPRTTKKNK